MYSKIFLSDDSFNKFLESFEVDSTTHFVVSINRHFNLTDPTNLDITKYRLRWCDTTTTPTIPYNGIPFIIVGHTVRACQNGPTPRPKNTKESLANSSYSRKRKLIPESKKKGCEARIKCRKIITFPEYKIDGQPTKHIKFKKMKALTNNFSNAQKKLEIHATFPSPSQHSNHPLGQMADCTQKADEVVINKIHRSVEDGVRGINNIKLCLDTFVADYIHEKFPDTKINKTNRRFYPTDRDIRNHLHLALSKLKKSELKEAVRCLQDEDGKTTVQIDDIVVTVDTNDFYHADVDHPGEDVIVIVDTSTNCPVDTANPGEDGVVTVDTTESCPVVAATSGEDVVGTVDTTESCPANQGEDKVMTVDTTESCPVVAATSGEDVVGTVDTTESCPVAAANPGQDGVVPVDTTESSPMDTANPGQDGVVTVDNTESCNVDTANPGKDGVVPVGATESSPVAAANPGQAEVVTVDTTESCPVVAAYPGEDVVGTTESCPVDTANQGEMES